MLLLSENILWGTCCGKACGHQSPDSCLALHIAVAVHVGFGDTVVFSKYFCPLSLVMKKLVLGLYSVLTVEALLEHSISSIVYVSWPLQGSPLLASGTWREPVHIVWAAPKSPLVWGEETGMSMLLFWLPVLVTLSKWPLATICQHNFTCVESKAISKTEAHVIDHLCFLCF